jgi:hypothetical protein
MRRISTHEARLAGNIVNVNWGVVDFDEFKAGMEEELEHGTEFPSTDVTQDDLIKVAKIALAHLREDPKYYSKLKKTFKETAMDGPAPVNQHLITDKTLDVLANTLGLDLEDVQPEEFRIGIIEELDQMMVYTADALNNEKLAKAALTAYDNLQANPTFYTNPPNQEIGHVLTGDQFAPDNFQYEELQKVVDHMINESFSDMIAKLKSFGGDAWEKVKSKFLQTTGTFKKASNTLSQKLQQLKSGIAPVIQIINQAQQESGEKLPVDQNMRIAAALPQHAQAAQSEIVSDRQEVEQAIQSRNTQQTENYFRELGTLLEEHTPKEKLNEGLTPVTIVGFMLATMGGTVMLFRGFEKLAEKFGLEKTAKAFHSAYHVAHVVEEKVVDYTIPDRLSYLIYNKLWKRGFKLKTSPTAQKSEMLTFEEYHQNAYGSRQKVENLIYKIVLAYFLINGAVGMVKAGISLLGVAEGTATAIKAVEIATAAGAALELFEPAIEQALD